MDKTIAVIDTGSSSMRGIVFDMAGAARYTAQRKYTMTVGADGSAVMDAAVFSGCLTELCAELAQTAKAMGWELLAVSLDSQRSSVLAVDDRVSPLHPVLMWYDKRCAPICDAFSDAALRQLYAASGMRLTPVSSAPKMLWLRRAHPDLYDRAHKLIGIHDYLLHCLTGRLVTDATCACRTALMDIRSFQWSDALCRAFEIDREKLCEILPPGAVVGSVTPDFCARTGLPRIPVVSAGGDQQCCILGQGNMEAGTVCVNNGSASYLAVPLRAPVADPRLEANLSAYFAPQPWLLEASTMGSGTLYSWFCRSFYPGEGLDAINREVAAQPPGSRGLICFSDFAGRGCPATDPNARGAFLNAGLQHTRGSFARALLEGICFDIADCVRHMQSLGVPIARIRATGGLTNFPTFAQTLADITGMEVAVPRCAEATAAGAFRLALAALGMPPPPSGDETAAVYFPDGDTHRLYAEIAVSRARNRKNLENMALQAEQNPL